MKETFQLYQSLRDKESLSNLLTLLLRLRQACTHRALLDGNQQQQRQITSSSKFDRLRQLLSDVWRDEPTRGVIVYSQWTTALDLVASQVLTSSDRATHARIDGDTTAQQRADAVKAFQQPGSGGGKCRLMLVSLMAGGLGLNLTRASLVVFLDPWFNPFAHRQACDRAHRMGQTRAVDVYHLYAADSMEQWVVKVQQQKLQKARTTIGDTSVESVGVESQDGGNGGGFTMNQVQSLVNHYLSRYRAPLAPPQQQPSRYQAKTAQSRGVVKRRAPKQQKSAAFRQLRKQFEKERARL